MEFIDSPYLGRNTGFRCSRRRESADKFPYEFTTDHGIILRLAVVAIRVDGVSE